VLFVCCHIVAQRDSAAGPFTAGPTYASYLWAVYGRYENKKIMRRVVCSPFTEVAIGRAVVVNTEGSESSPDYGASRISWCDEFVAICKRMRAQYCNVVVDWHLPLSSSAQRLCHDLNRGVLGWVDLLILAMQGGIQVTQVGAATDRTNEKAPTGPR